MVSEKQGLDVALAMAKMYGEVPSLALLWETGIFETVRDNALGITNTKLFRKALSWILAKAGIGDLGSPKGAAQGTMDPATIETMLATEEGTRQLDVMLTAEAKGMKGQAIAKGPTDDDLDEAKIAEDLEYDFSSDTSLPDLIDSGAPGSRQIRQRIDTDEGERGFTSAGVALFVARVIVATVRRYRSGTHHDPLPTAVEELFRAAYLAEVGKFAWDAMKTKAERMWIDDGEDPGVDGHGGGYILRRLEQRQAANPALTIDLVGHSAGSIAICEMLAAIDAKQRRIRFRNVVFLAPAARLDLFARWIVRGPRIFDRFRMFTMTDEWEKYDKLLGSIYPRSLLYLVSGCFEDRPDDAIAGMARFLRETTTSAGRDFDDVRQWLRQENRVVYAPSDDGAEEGLRTRSERHGDFDDDQPTLASLLSMARAVP
ncbi:alpha/beta hydrolase [Bradyrhizobium sp. 200]|uniref:hypothetical protein n=1 Tax=Bradyrhizobium sp. 200 TaxID=2782665 RepID=UPI0020000F11|nr:hypothetical protein [Bradyrhizobium sp. 200]UPJ49275.1 alpha/beta hydrolase [Bradyrhizobium sp. 200]